MVGLFNYLGITEITEVSVSVFLENLHYWKNLM